MGPCPLARSAAMTFNRIVDVEYDRQNRRTRYLRLLSRLRQTYPLGNNRHK